MSISTTEAMSYGRVPEHVEEGDCGVSVPGVCGESLS